MKVWIDQAACIGNGICAELAADVSSSTVSTPTSETATAC